MKKENPTNFSKYITPEPIDQLNQPAEKVFDFWSFVVGFIMGVGLWLW